VLAAAPEVSHRLISLSSLRERRVGCNTKLGARSVALLACIAGIVLAPGQLASGQSRLPSARRQRVPAPTEQDRAGTSYPAAQPSSGKATLAGHTLPAPAARENIPSGAPSESGPAGSLTLAELEGIALANNPTIAQAAAQVRAAQGQWLQAGLRPNPIIGYQASEVGNEGRSGQQGAFISQEFVRRGKLELSRAVGSRAVAQAQQDFAAQRLRVLNDVRSEYFNVLVAQRAMELTGELAQIGRQAVDTTEKLFRNEQIAYVDVLQARIEYDTGGIAVENARNRHAAAWRRLSSHVGVPNMVPRELSGGLEPPADKLVWEETLARLLEQSPELASARAGVARARAKLERAQVEPRPNLVVQLGLQHDNHSQYTIGNIQVGVPVPLLNRNQGNVQTAFADLRNAQAEVGRVELTLRNRLASAFEIYANARNQVEKYTQDILPDARNALDLIAKGYRQQQFSFLTLLTAQRTFAQASLAYLQSLQQLGVSRVAIEGLMLTGSLHEEHGIEVPRIETGIAPVFGPGRPPVETR
jgi:outer membrane protein, heavy metal efflux system